MLPPAKGRSRGGPFQMEGTAGPNTLVRVALVYWRNGGQCGCRRVEGCGASRAPAGQRESLGVF